MKIKIYISIIFLCAFTCVVSAQALQNSEKSDEQTKWIGESIQEINTLKVGDARANLLKIFTIEGGISTALKQTFVYRKCPYIKVDVEFEPIGRPERNTEGRITSVEDNRDKIKFISKPYLEFSVVD